jgi:multiple sugar transport system permease protein
MRAMSIPARTPVQAPPPGGRRPRGGPGMRRARVATARSLLLVVFALFAAFFLIPVIWLVLAPTKTDNALVQSSPFAFGSLHELGLTWHYLVTFENGALLVWLRNSAVYSFGALVITLVVMIMPASALVLPLFLEINAAHLIGTVWSVILPMSFYPFGVYLAYIYFSSSIPRDLLAAARLDGCSEWGVFRHVAVPLARPVVALVAFFSFVANWNNFFLPFVMLPSSNQYPIQVGLENLLSSTPSFNPAAGAGLDITRPELALAMVLAIAPVLIVFLFSQRALVSGMLAGATKE